MAKKNNTAKTTKKSKNKWENYMNTGSLSDNVVKPKARYTLDNSTTLINHNIKPTGTKINSAQAPYILSSTSAGDAIDVKRASTPSPAYAPTQLENARATSDSNFKNYKYPQPRNILNRRTGEVSVNSGYLKNIKYTDQSGTRRNSVLYENDVLPVPYQSVIYKNNNPKKMVLKADSVKFMKQKGKEYKNFNLNIVKTDRFQVNLDSKGNVAQRPDGTELSLADMMADVRKAIMLPAENESTQSAFNNLTVNYNRYKLPDPDLPLQHGHAHVFFVRPDCNILNVNGTLVDAIHNSPVFAYAYDHSPKLLGELVQNTSPNTDNQFMMSLSNFVSSFSLSDEYINADTYGRTYTGYKIAYGKNNIESKTASTFDVVFNDDRYLHIYQIIRLWAEYINGVYRGEFTPTKENMFNKILDYVGACYYFVTAEDGETIIFWSKYYGVFPTTVPSSQYSWGEGNNIQAPQLSVTFNYSFKEDFSPYSIYEFNYNSKIENATNLVTVPTYDYKLGHSSFKFGKKPFIEMVSDPNSDIHYMYKLRFTDPTVKATVKKNAVDVAKQKELISRSLATANSNLRTNR